MWTIDMRAAANDPAPMVFIFDDEGVLRWSGPAFMEALRYLAEWGQAKVQIDVDSAIFFFGPDSRV